MHANTVALSFFDPKVVQTTKFLNKNIFYPKEIQINCKHRYMYVTQKMNSPCHEKDE